MPTGKRSSRLTKKTGALSSVARHVVLPKGVVSTGWPAVRDMCARWGTEFDPWQEGILRAVLAKRADGLYAAGVGGVVISVCRQTGKTFTFGNLAFALCLLNPGTTVVWTAHRTRTSGETFRTMQAMAKAPKVSSAVSHVRRANGQEEICFANGSRILFGARESGFGRGFSKVDVIVFDEAQILSHKALDDMVAATNAAPNPLILYMGTPPKPSDVSEVFSDKRRQALAGKASDMVFVEFSADKDADPGSRAQWRKANPSYPHRVNAQAIERLRRQLGDESFRREGLGIWDEASSGELAFDAKAWASTEDGKAVSGKTRCFAVKFSVDGHFVALGAASKLADGRVLVDGVRIEPVGAGIGWLVGFLAEPARLASTAQIVVDGKSGAGYLVDRLASEGVGKRVTIVPRAEDVVTAHAMFAAAVTEGTLARAPGAELDREAGHALRRRIGTQGGFGWAAPEDDTVALLDAVTLAFWAAKTTRRRPRGLNDKGRKQVRVL